MASARPVSILFYAINGVGLGHLSRLVAIARQTRKLLEALGLPYDIRFLTTSEASESVRDFPVYKIPSKTMVAGTVAAKSYVAQSRFFVTNLVGLIRPDLLVLDTLPEGSFHEFLMMRDFAKKTVFINRHRDPHARSSRLHKNVMALYDLILVPDEPDEVRYPIEPRLQSRRHFCGRIHGFQPELALSREQVRRELGVPAGSQLIYVSAGGGGDALAEAHLGSLIDQLLQDPQYFLLVGYGPLYSGTLRYGPNMVAYTGPHVNRYFLGLDLALSAAGYNSYEELLAAKVPCLFFAQEKGLDRQDERIALGLEAGWHGQLHSMDPVLLRHQVDQALGFEFRDSIERCLAQRPIACGALVAASHLLDLYAQLKPLDLERRALFHVATCAREWPAQAPFVPTYQLVSRILASQTGVLHQAYDQAFLAWFGAAADPRLHQLVEPAHQICRLIEVLGLEPNFWKGFLDRFLAADPPLSMNGLCQLLVDLLETLVSWAKRGTLPQQFLGALVGLVNRNDLARVCREILAVPAIEPASVVQSLGEAKQQSRLDLDKLFRILNQSPQGVSHVCE